MKVMMNIEQPLCDKVNIKIRGGYSYAVQIKYVKLPLFYFICGRMGHGDKDCGENDDEKTPKKKYGLWLKASPWKKALKIGEKEENVEKKTSARKLFIPKPKKVEDKNIKKAVWCH